MKALILAAGLAVAAATPCLAHNYSSDLVCVITDIGGNKLTYAFANNTANANGSFGGTYVETAFEKNGRSVVSATGHRPIWYYGFAQNRNYGAAILSREAPGWAIGVVSKGVQGGYWVADAELWHDNRFIGRGQCARVDQGTPANQVGDQVD